MDTANAAVIVIAASEDPPALKALLTVDASIMSIVAEPDRGIPDLARQDLASGTPGQQFPRAGQGGDALPLRPLAHDGTIDAV